MFSFPDYNYNRYAYNSMRRPQLSPRSSYYMHPTVSSLMYSPFEYDFPLMQAGGHQHQKEEERRKRVQRQQALEERQRQRQLGEMEAREEEKRQRTMNANTQNRANPSGFPFPPGSILRGKDGRLYRVVSRPSCLREPSSYEDAKVDDSRFLSEHSDSDTSCSRESTMLKSHSDIRDIDYLNSKENMQTIKRIPTDETKSKSSIESEKYTHNKKSAISLVVEDVPIEEDDELRDLHSIWRNRAPSAGQWMEPIDNFDRQ